MSGGVVCYIERDLGGAVIKRVRLVAAGLSRSWTAPEAKTLSAQPSSGPGAAVMGTRTAAKWIAETVQSVGLKRLAWVCLDAEGSVCAWLSAPGPERSVIEASIAQAAQDAGTGDGAGLGAGRLLAMASPSGAMGLSAMPDISVQALANEEEELERAETAAGGAASATKTKAVASRRGKVTTLDKKQRYAVLAVADAPARVLLDELDQLGIEVEGVCSLWHAMARAWGESVAANGAARGTGDLLEQGGDARAIVLCEPGGRVVWSWSAGGELLAGGTIRLAQTSRPGGEVAPEPLVDGATRRLQEDAGPPSLHFTRAEAGRLVMDWLAWSVQLGRSPRRVVCLATPTLTDGSVEGAGVLGRTLAAQWGGATVDAGTYDDPVAATLSRLAGLGTDDHPAPNLPASSTSSRSALVPLCERPGRADRAMYRWAAGGVLLGAAAVGALGWQLGQAAGAARGEASVASAQRVEELRKLEAIIPNLSTDRTPVDTLETKVSQLREQGKQIKAPRPVIQEIVRLLKSLENAEGVKLNEFECNAMFNAKADLLVPNAETGPRVLESIRSIPGTLNWQGTVPASFGPATQRRYLLMGLWPTEERTPPGGGR